MNTLTLLTAVFHAAKLVCDVGVEAAGDAVPGQKRAKTNERGCSEERWVRHRGVNLCLLFVIHCLPAKWFRKVATPGILILILRILTSSEDFCFLRVNKGFLKGEKKCVIKPVPY